MKPPGPVLVDAIYRGLAWALDHEYRSRILRDVDRRAFERIDHCLELVCCGCTAEWVRDGHYERKLVAKRCEEHYPELWRERITYECANACVEIVLGEHGGFEEVLGGLLCR